MCSPFRPSPWSDRHMGEDKPPPVGRGQLFQVEQGLSVGPDTYMWQLHCQRVIVNAVLS